tara:strand:+ start:10410 stop:11390 length:981 start_codon:yes stop_codon:yes gene_type:complete
MGFKLSIILVHLMAFFVLSQHVYAQASNIESWKLDFPKTDFRKFSINLDEIMDGGPNRGEIPSVDNPKFVNASDAKNIGRNEPVITVEINDDARAYPIRILIFHEVVNDVVGGVPVTVTYCPLCNASLAFKRTFSGKVLEFEATGKLRKSDLVMYDRETESWWQQFTGEAIIGFYSGEKLEPVPSRIESFKIFKERHPKGIIQVPKNPKFRHYGDNPYLEYDSRRQPPLFDGTISNVIPPLARVVAVGGHAWPLKLLKDKKRIKVNDLVLEWVPGQNSSLSKKKIKRGRDIGNVTVMRNNRDITYHVPFAFAFLAFNPEGVIHTEN